MSRGAAGPLALLAAVALLLAGCGLSGGSPQSSAGATGAVAAAARATAAERDAGEAERPVTPIAWTDCTQKVAPEIAGLPGSDRPLRFSCGSVRVPVDYADPTGPTLPVFALRAVLSGQTDRIGSLVIDPGGPGASGADEAVFQALTLPVDVLRRFDLVGFDPRGVGLSTPLTCIPDALKDQLYAAEPDPVTTAQLDDVLALQQRVADGCVQKYHAALGSIDTVDTARDMDRLRAALGDRRLTYLGWSYGTTLGSVYAELFPRRYRALVLDGVVDPDAGLVTQAEEVSGGLEHAFDAFAQNCTDQAAGCPVGPDPRAAVTALLAQADADPIPTSTAGDERRATAGWVLQAVTAAMYAPGQWAELAQALAAAQRGDAAGLLALADALFERSADGRYGNLLDALTAVDCADSAVRPTTAQVTSLVAAWRTAYPLFGPAQAVGLHQCTVWPAHRTPLPARRALTGPTVLVVGNTGDPVTPYQGATRMTRDLGSAVLLTWQGQGHTSYPQTACVTSAVDAYLIDLTPPPAGTVCPPTS